MPLQFFNSKACQNLRGRNFNYNLQSHYINNVKGELLPFQFTVDNAFGTVTEFKAVSILDETQTIDLTADIANIAKIVFTRSTGNYTNL